MVKIRLTQTGTKNRKTYRIIAIDQRKRRDGSAIEVIGFVDPLVKPPKVVIKLDRIDYWTGVGAQVSKSVSDLLGKYRQSQS